jgi:hypothetical protein
LKREVVGEWRGRRLSSIKRPEIHALLDKIVDRPAPVVACRVRVVLHHLGEWAVERALIETNPARGIKPPAVEASRDRVLTDAEVRALWAARLPVGRSGTNSSMTGARPVLPNGLVFDRSLPEVLQTKQHSQHPFEFAVEMDLVATELLQLIEVERFAECLLADQR